MYYPFMRQTNNIATKRMTVYGNSIITIEPNVSKVQLGVVTQNEEPALAQQKNATIVQQVIQSLLALRISQENIKTLDYHIYPIYDYEDGNQQFKGYQVTHMLLVTIENLEQTGAVIDTALENGVNRVSNIVFTAKNKSVYYQQALKKALEDAYSKARTIANTLMLNLDPTPARILEQTTELPPTPSPYKIISQTEIVGGVTTPIEPGKLEIEAKVEVEFYYSG